MHTTWIPLKLGHSRIDLGPITLDWFDRGGFVRSQILWRYRGQLVAFVFADFV
jgi:hypothetical protein